jgi:PAS domain S-box-containing protein
MIIFGRDGAVLFANHQATTLFGYSRDEFSGLSVEALLPERLRERHVAHRDRYTADPWLRPMGTGLDLLARRKDGREFPIEISLSPVEENGTTLVTATIRDMTDRKRAEQDLKAARAAADDANQAKTRFIAVASHDLRQPVETIAILNAALRRLATSADALEAIEHQSQAIATMSRLLEALLDISKLESGAFTPACTDFRVATLLEELRAEFTDLAREKGIGLTIAPCGATVHSDPALVGQALRNLLSNAIKYTQRGSVQVRACQVADRVRVDIADSGIGIAPGDLSHIYDAFYQIGGTARAPRSGYGLGLSIVQRIVQRLGADLQVQSQPGKGSTFSLVLPAAIAAPVPTVLPRQRTRAAAAAGRAVMRHILLVEDDAGVRNAMQMFLKVAGYRVTPAASLAEALDRARTENGVDLLIADYHLDDGHTGIEVIGAVRAALGANLKSILMTGDAASVARDFGGDANLRLAGKPVEADKLVGMIDEFLRADADRKTG